ncbi:MAG: phosphoribosyltransferase family protein, partial [Oscillospiraceae bacterium]
ICLRITNPFIKKFYASYYYDESPRGAVLEAKFYRPARFINTLLTDISIDIKEILSQNSIDIIISVPFHKSKLHRFEFDVPKEMAKRIGTGFNIPVAHPIEKVRRTAKQHSLSLEGRKVNLIGAFKMVGDVRGKNILLIDDVITSANTVIALATQLKIAGAKDIIAWAYTYNNHKKGEKYGK